MYYNSPAYDFMPGLFLRINILVGDEEFIFFRHFVKDCFFSYRMIHRQCNSAMEGRIRFHGTGRPFETGTYITATYIHSVRKMQAVAYVGKR